MVNRNIAAILLAVTLVVCVVAGVLSASFETLDSWYYAASAYLAFSVVLFFGYLVFSDSSWYIAPLKHAKVVQATAQKQVVVPQKTKPMSAAKLEGMKNARNKKRRVSKK